VIVVATENGSIQVANIGEDKKIQVDGVQKLSHTEGFAFGSLIYALK
jgi:hypothetical protein